jgi:hypothetical protein
MVGMRRVAFIVGIQDYLDKTIGSVDFAENDVIGIANALVQLGLAASDITTLVSGQATKTVIESRLGKIIKSLSKDDVFYLYYAGHGFAENNTNYITCHDTQLNDMANTSIPLHDILRQLKESEIKQSVIFIDACESGLPLDSSMRRMYSGMSEEELDEFLAEAEGTICFSACKADEGSYSHAKIKHGVWSYHVIRALSGDAPEALVNRKAITPTSLQNYLSKQVPLSLRTLRSSGDTQTPWMCGAMSRDLLIADVGEILEARQNKKAPLANQLKKGTISSMYVKSVRSLSGFRKGSHTVPNQVSGTTQSFVEDISKDEIRGALDAVHVGIRKHLKYKRADLKVSCDGGSASIITPDFDYHVEVTINEDDPSTVTFHEFIENISDGHIIMSDKFDSAFNSGFNSVDFIFEDEIDIDVIIDKLEDLEDSSLHLDYDSTSTIVKISIDNFPAEIVVEPDRMRIVVQRPIAPRKLLPLVEEGLKQVTSRESFALLPLIDENEGT